MAPTPAQPPEEERLRWTVLCSMLLVSDNSDHPPIKEYILQYPHPGNIGNALSRVKMAGELGKEQGRLSGTFAWLYSCN